MANLLSTIPDQIRENSLTTLLDSFIRKYSHLARKGRIYGLALADQDAKVLAVNTFFDTDFNYWDIGAIGAALYGVAKQGKDFFQAQQLERASMIFNDRQCFVHMLGRVLISKKETRELILIVIGKNLNIGLIIMLMKRNARIIKTEVEEDIQSQKTMQMSEREFQKHIYKIKKELFNLG